MKADQLCTSNLMLRRTAVPQDGLGSEGHRVDGLTRLHGEAQHLSLGFAALSPTYKCDVFASPSLLRSRSGTSDEGAASRSHLDQ